MRSEPVIVAGEVIGRTVRINLAEVEAIREIPGWPYHRALGVFWRRSQARNAILADAMRRPLIFRDDPRAVRVNPSA